MQRRRRHTGQEIKRIFAVMDLDTQSARNRFIELGRLGEGFAKKEPPAFFTEAGNTADSPGGPDDARLEPTS